MSGVGVRLLIIGPPASVHSGGSLPTSVAAPPPFVITLSDHLRRSRGPREDTTGLAVRPDPQQDSEPGTSTSLAAHRARADSSAPASTRPLLPAPRLPRRLRPAPQPRPTPATARPPRRQHP